MKFVSTKGGLDAVSIARAIRDGAAPDGGLYVPAAPLRIDPAELGDGESLPLLAARLLAPYFDGDALADQLPAICGEAFDFPAPLVALDAAAPGLRLLELFHGPTGAFKDFGARFLMACLDRLGDPEGPLTVLVATSGDTGGAVGCAAEGRRALRTVILYPRGRVSAFQRLQLSCWNAPNLSFEVEGDFDDCQHLAKSAFADPALARKHRLTSANSINVGRLLPQMVYIASAALRIFRDTGVAPGFVIPTGNLGHALAALWARGLGLPIGPIVAATNANRTLQDWSRTGRYEPGPSLTTIANAMDVGAPSNFERLVRISGKRRRLHVESVDDDSIRRRIRQDYRRTGTILCPHTAVAVEAYWRLDPEIRAQRTWVAAATAHPYKFAEVVEPLIGEVLHPPAALAAMVGRRANPEAMPATFDGLKRALETRIVEDGAMEAAA